MPLMTTEALRVYADTSVYGGVLDDRFASVSRKFFQQVREGKFTLIISPLVQLELHGAPQEVRELFAEMAAIAETVGETDDAVRLMAAYVAAGILSDSARTDALHVALATTSGCRAIISWNFKHIVHFGKIPLYNAVNRVNGYPEIGIHTPQEVIRYEDEDF